jgi:hypothetical protein
MPCVHPYNRYLIRLRGVGFDVSSRSLSHHPLWKAVINSSWYHRIALSLYHSTTLGWNADFPNPSRYRPLSWGVIANQSWGLHRQPYGCMTFYALGSVLCLIVFCFS